MTRDPCETEHLRLDPDDGRVFRKTEDGGEHIGHIDDPWVCPYGLWGEWDQLHDEWGDRCQFGTACRLAAGQGYYELLGSPGVN